MKAVFVVLLLLAVLLSPLQLALAKPGNSSGGATIRSISSCVQPAAAKITMPVTGLQLAGMDVFESRFCELLRNWCVPGASIAVSKGGKLVYARGYFAMGWEVYPVTSGSGCTFSRVGTMPGSMSFLVRRYDDTCWSVLFNSRLEDQYRFMNEAKAMIWEAVNNQKKWN